MYDVTRWGSHPSLENDDAWEGDDFPSFQAAKAYYDSDADYTTAYITMQGPNIDWIRENPAYDKARCEMEHHFWLMSWRQELANEAGMLHGLQAYNEAMGWDEHEHDL